MYEMVQGDIYLENRLINKYLHLLFNARINYFTFNESILHHHFSQLIFLPVEKTCN